MAMADRVKVGVQFSGEDMARIERFGAGLDIRDPSRSAVVRELTLRALDAIDEEKRAASEGVSKRKARAS